MILNNNVQNLIKQFSFTNLITFDEIDSNSKIYTYGHKDLKNMVDILYHYVTLFLLYILNRKIERKNQIHLTGVRDFSVLSVRLHIHLPACQNLVKC